jgi:hypothetical protein
MIFINKHNNAYDKTKHCHYCRALLYRLLEKLIGVEHYSKKTSLLLQNYTQVTAKDILLISR